MDTATLARHVINTGEDDARDELHSRIPMLAGLAEAVTIAWNTTVELNATSAEDVPSQIWQRLNDRYHTYLQRLADTGRIFETRNDASRW